MAFLVRIGADSWLAWKPGTGYHAATEINADVAKYPTPFRAVAGAIASGLCKAEPELFGECENRVYKLQSA